MRSDDISDPIDRLKARWVADGLKLLPGASSEALDAFEARYRVVLPPAFRRYLAAVDGMTGELDRDWPSDRYSYCFWGLPTLLSVRDYRSYEMPGEPMGGDGTDWTDRWFPFADFLIHSHAYAIRLTADPDDGGVVCLWDYGQVRYHVAPTFEAFLDIYLASSNQSFGDRRMFGEGAIVVND
jgi:SMI1 / KNR4 family (SUKH-1)